MKEDQRKKKQRTTSQLGELRKNIAELKPGQYTVNQQITDIIEFLPDATFIINNDKKVIAWNRAIEKMTGIKKADIIGKGDYAYAIPFYGERRPVLADVFGVLHNEDIESRYQNIERDGDAIFAEVHIPVLAERKDVFLWVKASPLYSYSGTLVGAIESIRDITARRRSQEILQKTKDELEERVNKRTADLKAINEELRHEIEERKKAEKELNESVRRFNDIINFLPDATMVIDGKGKVIAWNHAMEITTGIKAENMLGKGDYEYAIPFYGERRPVLLDIFFLPDHELESQYKKLKRNKEQLAVEAHVENLNGREAYFIATASAFYDSNGNIIGGIETIHDITDRKRTEEALKQAEAKYRNIFENAVEGIFQTTLEGTFIDVNPAFARIFGYSSPEVLIETITDIGRQMYVDPEARLQFIDMIFREDRMINHEAQCYRADGSVIWVSQSARALWDENGTLQRLEGFLEDITEQKKTEEESYRTKKLESIGILAGGIAHDFNNMLGAILGYMSFAKMLIDPLSKPFSLLDKAEMVLKNASDLTKKLITFSKGGTPLLQPLSVEGLIRKTAKHVLKDSPDIQCKYYVPEDVPLLMVDESQIKQVISNIVANARESMPDGGDINIFIENVALTSKDNVPQKEGKYVKISIEDHGVGIAADDILKVFDPYFSTKEMGSQKGMGLGLAVCYSIVKNHGGFINVDSEVGNGSTFNIFLPLSEPD
ncbi:MAG: PAS domain S-box protein [Proteobacteria bacterium]|nr:PAS domain S-box protein [Pseudomonadota bacterium]